MIKLTNLSMPLQFTEDILRQKIAQRLHISAQEIQSVLYLKRSVDARKKPKITVILTVAVAVSNEEKILRRAVKMLTFSRTYLIIIVSQNVQFP